MVEKRMREGDSVWVGGWRREEDSVWVRGRRREGGSVWVGRGRGRGERESHDLLSTFFEIF